MPYQRRSKAHHPEHGALVDQRASTLRGREGTRRHEVRRQTTDQFAQPRYCWCTCDGRARQQVYKSEIANDFQCHIRCDKIELLPEGTTRIALAPLSCHLRYTANAQFKKQDKHEAVVGHNPIPEAFAGPQRGKNLSEDAILHIRPCRDLSSTNAASNHSCTDVLRQSTGCNVLACKQQDDVRREIGAIITSTAPASATATRLFAAATAAAFIEAFKITAGRGHAQWHAFRSGAWHTAEPCTAARRTAQLERRRSRRQAEGAFFWARRHHMEARAGWAEARSCHHWNSKSMCVSESEQER
mmetsp:Transcript_47841/g.70150  ORF Transcript_47841/g.70150 Transcript_47841/m.70150 type:complete len:300 (-) Transcript_47841:114-1013(-)